MKKTHISSNDNLKELNNNEKFIEINKYKIKNENNFLKILISKSTDNIIIKCLYYEIKFNTNDLSILTKIVFNSLDECYNFIRNSFQQNKVKIKEISKNLLKLEIEISDNIKSKEKNIEICLITQLNNGEYNINNLNKQYFELKQEIDNLKDDNKKLKEENKNIMKKSNEIIKNNSIIKNDINILKLKNNNFMGQYINMNGQLYQNPEMILFGMNYMNQFNDINNFVENNINIFFNTSTGKKINIVFDYEETIEDVLTKYLKRVNLTELIGNLKGKLIFILDAKTINFGDKRKLKDVLLGDLRGMIVKKIFINDIYKL